KKRLRMDAMLLDEFKSMKPVPSRFEKSHALLIESMGEEIKARTSNIAGDKEAARQHNLRALECAKQYAEEAGEGLKGAMKDYVDKLVSQDG
ncbi:MAG: hypothetical protein Q7S07_03235, partial [Candidatus Omnitrophota bacterium]|nr:hypothetical protein [Candidatus Omnitrophota bacterium]